MTRPALPLLYTYRRCPYAMRARMALLVAGVDFDAHEIVLRDKPSEMLALSPKGQVPVLRLPSGQVLEQSLDIMRWALVARDPDGWWTRSQSEGQAELQALCDGAFKTLLDRYKYPERCGEGRGEQPRDQAVELLLRPLNAQLARFGQLGGGMPCASDIAIFPFVRQFAAVNPAWFAPLPLPALQAWLAGWLVHPLFAAAMVKLPSREVVRFPALAATSQTPGAPACCEAPKEKR